MVGMLFSFTLSLLPLATLASSPWLLLVTPNVPRATLPPCASHFLGSYGTSGNRYTVYRSSVECTLDAELADSFDEAHLVPVEEHARVVYLQEAGVDGSLVDDKGTFVDQLDAFLGRVRRAAAPDRDISQQTVLSSGLGIEASLLYRTSTSALVSVPESLLPVLDTLLPRLFVPVVLPEGPHSLLPVPPRAVKRVANVLASLKFNPDVAAIVNHLSVVQMQKDIRFLTGEDGVSGIMSRHSFTEGALTAAKWIKDRIESTGATCELRKFLVGFAPNVICRYQSSVNTTATVILSAHYDSRGTFGSTRAPGGDDDGSGVVSLLGMARAIQGKKVAFQSNVELVAFAGEEQGLLGSRAYAKQLRDADANVTLMIQADMLAYHRSGEPPQLGLPDLIGTPEAAQLVANVSAIYSPELTVGFTPACCSDHQTFHEQGFPATQVFERAGPIADPFYHRSGDLSDRKGYDFGQIRSIAKVTFATLLHTAGFTQQTPNLDHE